LLCHYSQTSMRRSEKNLFLVCSCKYNE
jgi:hypothetical protein